MPLRKGVVTARQVREEKAVSYFLAAAWKSVWEEGLLKNSACVDRAAGMTRRSFLLDEQIDTAPKDEARLELGADQPGDLLSEDNLRRLVKGTETCVL